MVAAGSLSCAKSAAFSAPSTPFFLTTDSCAQVQPFTRRFLQLWPRTFQHSGQALVQGACGLSHRHRMDPLETASWQMSRPRGAIGAYLWRCQRFTILHTLNPIAPGRVWGRKRYGVVSCRSSAFPFSVTHLISTLSTVHCLPTVTWAVYRSRASSGSRSSTPTLLPAARLISHRTLLQHSRVTRRLQKSLPPRTGVPSMFVEIKQTKAAEKRNGFQSRTSNVTIGTWH